MDRKGLPGPEFRRGPEPDGHPGVAAGTVAIEGVPYRRFLFPGVLVEEDETEAPRILEVLVPCTEEDWADLVHLRESGDLLPATACEPATIFLWERQWDVRPLNAAACLTFSLGSWASGTEYLLDVSFLPAADGADAERKTLHFNADHDLAWVGRDRTGWAFDAALLPFALLIDFVTSPVQLPLFIYAMNSEH